MSKDPAFPAQLVSRIGFLYSTGVFPYHPLLSFRSGSGSKSALRIDVGYEPNGIGLRHGEVETERGLEYVVGDSGVGESQPWLRLIFGPKRAERGLVHTNGGGPVDRVAAVRAVEISIIGEGARALAAQIPKAAIAAIRPTKTSTRPTNEGES